MKISIQWATNPPADFIDYEINSNEDFALLPYQDEPDDTDKVTDKQGYVNMLNIEGTGFSGDHVGIDIQTDKVLVGVWNDDFDDWDAVPFGRLYTYNIVQDSSIPVPGKISVKFSHAQSYANRETLESLFNDGPWARRWYDDVLLKPWYEFPAFEHVRHGIWLDEDLYQAHELIRTPRYRNG